MSKFWLWEGDFEQDEDAVEKCVSAHPDSFALAAGMLLQWAFSFPGSNLVDELNTKLTIPPDQQVKRDMIVQVARQLLKPVGCGDELDMSFRLRNKPTDGCIIEQSFDEGVTWSTAFDLSLCAALSGTNYSANYSYVRNFMLDGRTFIENLYNQYDGDVTNIYPQATYDVGEPVENDRRNLALCYALERAVDVVCDGVIAGISEAEKAAALGIAAVAAAVGLFVLVTVASGGLGLPAAVAAYGSLGTGATAMTIGLLGAGGAAAAWMNTVIANGQREAYEDHDARAEVVCKLYEELEGVTLSESAYADALNSHGLTGHAGTIADAMDGFNAIPENFAGFANLAAQSYAAANAGIITDNDCECYDLIVTRVDANPIPAILTISTDGGNFTGGDNRIVNSPFLMSIDVSPDAWVVTKVSITMAFGAATGATVTIDGVTYNLIRGVHVGGETYVYDAVIPSVPTNTIDLDLNEMRVVAWIDVTRLG